MNLSPQPENTLPQAPGPEPAPLPALEMVDVVIGSMRSANQVVLE